MSSLSSDDKIVLGRPNKKLNDKKKAVEHSWLNI